MKLLRTYRSVLLLMLVIMPACTLRVDNAGSALITEQDLQTATQIIGGAVSNNQSGAVLSITDALQIIAQSHSGNMKTASGPQRTQVDRTGRKENYRHRYNEKIGTHLVSFIRFYNDPFFDKRETDSLSYRYTDETGIPVAFPRERRDNIAALLFYGQRSGRITTLNEALTFRRQDSLLVTGIGRGNRDLSIEGRHQESGNRSRQTPGGKKVTRSYELQIVILRLQAPQKAFNFDGSIALLLKGDLSVHLKLNRRADAGGPLNLSGTIHLNGDGTALLNIQGRSERFQINLTSGDVFNIDEAYEGRIRAVDVPQQSFVLQNGLEVQFSDANALKETPFNNFQILQDTLQAGAAVFASGTGRLQDGYFAADNVQLVSKASLASGESAISFNTRVTSVNVKARFFTLAKKAEVAVSDRTVIDKRGDFTMLREVASALKNQEIVYAKGEAMEKSAYRGDATALRVTFVRVNE